MLTRTSGSSGAMLVGSRVTREGHDGQEMDDSGPPTGGSRQSSTNELDVGAVQGSTSALPGLTSPSSSSIALDDPLFTDNQPSSLDRVTSILSSTTTNSKASSASSQHSTQTLTDVKDHPARHSSVSLGTAGAVVSSNPSSPTCSPRGMPSPTPSAPAAAGGSGDLHQPPRRPTSSLEHQFHQQHTHPHSAYRLSTRPSNKRASSYSSSVLLLQQSQQVPAASSFTHAPGQLSSPPASSSHALAHASSISLPLTTSDQHLHLHSHATPQHHRPSSALQNQVGGVNDSAAASDEGHPSAPRSVENLMTATQPHPASSADRRGHASSTRSSHHHHHTNASEAISMRPSHNYGFSSASASAASSPSRRASMHLQPAHHYYRTSSPVEAELRDDHSGASSSNPSLYPYSSYHPSPLQHDSTSLPSTSSYQHQQINPAHGLPHGAQYHYFQRSPPHPTHHQPSPPSASSSPPTTTANLYRAPPSTSSIGFRPSPATSRQSSFNEASYSSLPVSPSTASRLAKGKGRSRNPSATSSGPAGADYIDTSTGFGYNDGTDLASDAGGGIENVRETDRLRSAKDALGRKMINQYARVAELGRGVHGRVWLCEDTETGEFFAVKSVNRENKKQRSLKRSQAQAEALRRQQVDDREDEEDRDSHHDYAGSASGSHCTGPTSSSYQSDEAMQRANRAGAMFEVDQQQRDPNATFDEEMQLNASPQHDVVRKKSSAKRRPIVMDEKVKQEIAIMKRCHHPHVVKLREVIDDQRSKKIFIVLEYMPGGQIEWSKDDKPTMTVDESRSVFRDVVLGLEYLHHQGIIHRDIKPANLLWTQDHKTVKISDFGVSHVSEALARSSANNPTGGRVGLVDDRALRKTEGSPAFFAPELCAGVETTPIATPVVELERISSRPEYFRQPGGTSGQSPRISERLSPLALTGTVSRPQTAHRQSTASVVTISQPLSAQQQQAHRIRSNDRPIVGKGIDVWALGVTLYCLLFGKTPFHEATSEYELYNMIPKKEIVIPPVMGSDELPTGSGADSKTVEENDEYAEGRLVVDLLSRLLEKDPIKRIQLHEVKRHPWVLRNLGDSQTWLAEHDLADTGVVHVTEEEVQHATAARTSATVPAGGLKASFRRFGEMFGQGLRRSIRRERDRSKSISSTSASIATNSNWGDGRSEPSGSRVASRQASLVKKKPSRALSSTGTMSGTDDTNGQDSKELDSNLVSHAMALKRKLTSAKAAQNAREAATVPSSPSQRQPSDAFLQAPQNQHHPHNLLHLNSLSRSFSGESTLSRQREASLTRQRSTGGNLQLPINPQRRMSANAIDGLPAPASPSSLAPPGNRSGRPSTSSNHSQTWSNASSLTSPGTGSDTEGRLIGGLRNAWAKLRSGSRTPAAASTPRSTRSRRGTQAALAAVQGRNLGNDGLSMRPIDTITDKREVNRVTVQDSLLACPTTPEQRSASFDALGHAAAMDDQQAPIARFSASAPYHPPIPRGSAVYAAEHSSSDSSESMSDSFDEDEGDYGEALSPLDHDDTTQPSSFGTHQPLMWSDQAQGWRTNPALAGDPLGQFFLRQPPRATPPEPATSSASANTTMTKEDTPRAIHKLSLSNASDDVDRERAKSSRSPSLHPPPSRDGSIYKDYTARIPPPSPGRLSDVCHGEVADDENGDSDEEEEVMIKPRSRLRRGTNTSSNGALMGGHSGLQSPSLPNQALPTL